VVWKFWIYSWWILQRTWLNYNNSIEISNYWFNFSIIIDYFNSPDHETTKTNIASDRGICLTPGFFNDHNGEFAWTNFDCDDYFDCKLCIHSKDKRKAVIEFV
jgi:hypothetical protein